MTLIYIHTHIKTDARVAASIISLRVAASAVVKELSRTILFIIACETRGHRVCTEERLRPDFAQLSRG